MAAQGIRPAGRGRWIKQGRHLLLMAVMAACLLASPVQGLSRSQGQPPPQASLEQAENQIDGFPVLLDGRPVMVIRRGGSGFSAEERAHTITRRLSRLAQNDAIPMEELRIQPNPEDNSLLLSVGQDLLLTVTERDAQASRVSTRELAEQTLNDIQAAVTQFRRDRKPGQLIKNTLYGVIATVAFLLLCLAVIGLTGKLFPALGHWMASRVPGIHVKGAEIVSPARISSFCQQIFKVIRLVVLLVLFFYYAAFLLRLFPWTRAVGESILAYLYASVELVLTAIGNYLPNLFVICFICLIAYYLLRMIRPFFTAIDKGSLVIPGFYADWANPTYYLLRVLVIALAAVLAFPYLPGFNSPAFQGVSVFLGLLLSLGSTSAITNVIGGVILIYTRAFRVGDHIRVGDVIGDIIETNFLAVRICTPANEVITIPNSTLLTNKVVNYNISSRDLRRCLVLQTTITLGYDVPWRKVHDALIEAALATDHVLRHPAPFILQTSLDDATISYQVNAYTNEPNLMVFTTSELHQHIQDKCNEKGIEILSPSYMALRDGNRAAMPAASLPKHYVAPPFHVEVATKPGGEG